MSPRTETPRLSRLQLAESILKRIEAERARASDEFHRTPGVPSFVVEDLLPREYALAIHAAFPPVDRLVLKKTLGQLKYVGYQMDTYDPLLEEAIYAFQDPRIVRAVSEITGIRELLPDGKLYAGGISLMTQGQYLNPHLDNSHDKDRNHYRVLNLLYYVTPDWRDDFGGHLELWDRGPGHPQRTVHSRFNRLVVMQTDERSWHSVSKVLEDGRRCCVSNYYFSPHPAGRDASYHVTSFRGWPEQKLADVVMRIDSGVRLAVRKIGGNWLFKNPHVYKK
ncbi:MAG TPA: 2OG-Fe(II) oxygenase [Bryobacteraceae bacterium]|nr:2OG-Fe(II) oxygenase [Bryobacteraceae bacterium]